MLLREVDCILASSLLQHVERGDSVKLNKVIELIGNGARKFTNRLGKLISQRKERVDTQLQILD